MEKKLFVVSISSMLISSNFKAKMKHDAICLSISVPHLEEEARISFSCGGGSDLRSTLPLAFRGKYGRFITCFGIMYSGKDSLQSCLRDSSNSSSSILCSFPSDNT